MINSHIQEKYDIDRSINFNATFHPHDPNIHKYTKNPRNFYISKIGDPLSVGLLSHSNPRNLKILMRDIGNPKYNHSIQNFVS